MARSLCGNKWVHKYVHGQAEAEGHSQVSLYHLWPFYLFVYLFVEQSLLVLNWFGQISWPVSARDSPLHPTVLAIKWLQIHAATPGFLQEGWIQIQVLSFIG